MRLETRRRGVKVTEELRTYLKERLRLALARFGRHIDCEPDAAVLFARINHRKADAGTCDRSALNDFGARIAAENRQSMQISGTPADRAHLA